MHVAVHSDCDCNLQKMSMEIEEQHELVTSFKV